VHAVESVVIEWTHQIREVLKKDSAQPLLEGLNPIPYVEMEFWKVKSQNLECIYDQVDTVSRHSVSVSSNFPDLLWAWKTVKDLGILVGLLTGHTTLNRI